MFRMIARDISLKPYNTYGLDYKAEHFISIRSEDEASELLSGGNVLNEPIFILGGGSNILFTQNFTGTIIHPLITGITIEASDSDSVLVSTGAGLSWDSLVEWSVNKGFGGLENLSLIPGSIGAVPVQNIGAYGVEAKDVIEKVRTLSLNEGLVREFTVSECRFSYRSSIFKEELKGKYLITRVYFRLKTKPGTYTEYGSLLKEAQQLGPLSISTVRQAVINIRKRKLPETGITGNAGSFFKNPVVTEDEAENLKRINKKIPVFRDDTGNFKLSAAWMIEQCGWKGRRSGDAGVYDKHALVLVNYGNASGKEIFQLSELIKKSVFDKFGILLQREVEVI